MNMLKNNIIAQILLHKIGRTKNEPHKRVNVQAYTNGEDYDIAEIYHTEYNSFVEFVIHRYFQDCRVTKTDSKDGKTEWFLAPLEVIKEGINKIRMAMYYIHND